VVAASGKRVLRKEQNTNGPSLNESRRRPRKREGGSKKLSVKGKKKSVQWSNSVLPEGVLGGRAIMGDELAVAKWRG